MGGLKRYATKIVMMLMLLCLGSTGGALAVPAAPNLIEVTQEDGSKIAARMQGDEWFHWISTVEGYAITEVDGYYYYVNYTIDNRMVVSRQRVMVEGKMCKPDSTIKKPTEGRVAPTIPSPAVRSRISYSPLQTYVPSSLNKTRK